MPSSVERRNQNVRSIIRPNTRPRDAGTQRLVSKGAVRTLPGRFWPVCLARAVDIQVTGSAAQISGAANFGLARGWWRWVLGLQRSWTEDCKVLEPGSRVRPGPIMCRLLGRFGRSAVCTAQESRNDSGSASRDLAGTLRAECSRCIARVLGSIQSSVPAPGEKEPAEQISVSPWSALALRSAQQGAMKALANGRPYSRFQRRQHHG